MGEYLQMLELVIPGGMFRNASEHFKHSMYKWFIFYLLPYDVLLYFSSVYSFN